MPTSAGYNPPECNYAPRMTRAQALALRAAGTLNENCHVIITDGPTIGTTGNTSATEIELHPTSPTAFGLEARVHTTFASSTTTAWDGLYDIDLGTSGSIIKLTDNFDNTVEDTAANAPCVHTQWPWHLGSASVRNNKVAHASLPGWPSAGTFTVQDNVINGGTFTLTGMTGNLTLQNCLFQNATINATNKTGNINFSGFCQFVNCSITTSGGNDTYQRSYFGNCTITHTGTGNLPITDCKMTNFFRVSHTGATTCTLTRSDFSNQGTGASDIQHSATVGNTSIIDTELIAGNNGLGLPNIINDGTTGVSNTVNISRCKFVASHLIRKQAGASAQSSVLLSNSIFRGGTAIVDATPTSTGQIAIIGADIQGGSVISNGGAIIIGQDPVTNFIAGSAIYGATIQTLAGSTRTLQLTGCIVQGGIVQLSQVGGSTGQYVIDFCRIGGPTGTVVVDIQGSVTVVGAIYVLRNSEIINGGRVISLSSDVNNNFIEDTQVLNGALLTLPAGNSNIKFSRITNSANINTGAFRHTQLVVDVPLTKTLTANNVNRLADKAFDDTV